MKKISININIRSMLACLVLLAFTPANADNILTPSPGFLLTWDGNDGDGTNPVPANLATEPGVTVITSSDLGKLLGLEYHLAANVNDGLYGNANSWIGGFGDPAYIAIVLPRRSVISGIAFGRDNLGSFNLKTAVEVGGG